MAMSETSMFSSENQISSITSMSNKPVLKPVLKFDIKIIRECPIHRVGKPVLKGNLPDVIHHTKGNIQTPEGGLKPGHLISQARQKTKVTLVKVLHLNLLEQFL